MPAKKATINIDGASRNNPGPAGIGITIAEDGKKVKEVSEYIGKVSNNVAEYTAFLMALIEANLQSIEEIVVKTDSQLLAHQINGQYKVKSDNIKPLFLLAKTLLKTFKKYQVVHIRREANKEADRLASEAVKKHLRS